MNSRAPHGPLRSKASRMLTRAQQNIDLGNPRLEHTNHKNNVLESFFGSQGSKRSEFQRSKGPKSHKITKIRQPPENATDPHGPRGPDAPIAAKGPRDPGSPKAPATPKNVYDQTTSGDLKLHIGQVGKLEALKLCASPWRFPGSELF